MKLQLLGSLDFDEKICGKKALNLHLLKKEGFPIPDGFVVSSDLDLTHIGPGKLQSAIDQIGGFPVAVRSSGFFEDSDSASFAGQYTSFLGLNSLEQVLEKIAECRKQAQSDHLKKYSEERGLKEIQFSKISILIQKMVPASRAGVSFCIHPLTGREEESLHEVCSGLGENLVSGHVTPSQYVYNYLSEGVVSSSLGTDGAILSEDELKILTKHCWSASSYFGTAQDIEWAFDHLGNFFFLQSRPITKIQFRTDVSEMTNADLRDGGVSSKVCTTLMYSLYAEAFDTSMQKYMSDIYLFPSQKQVPWMHNYYGHVYWNASQVKKCLFKIPGFDEKSFDEDLGIQKNYGLSGPVKIPSNDFRILLRAIPTAISLEYHFSKCLSATEQFSQQYEQKFQEWNLLINQLQAEDIDKKILYGKFHEFIMEFFLWTEKSYFTTIYNNSNLQSLFKDSIRKLSTTLNIELHIEKLISGLTDISHLQMQIDFINLYEIGEKQGLKNQEWKDALGLFISKNYFHSDAELDISVPRWEEKPEVIQNRIEAMLKSKIKPANPDITSKRQRDEYLAERAHIHSVIDQKANFISAYFTKKKLDSLLDKSRLYLSRREKMREYSTRTYYLVRKFILMMGKTFAQSFIIENSDDIFHLSIKEILSLSSGHQNLISPDPQIKERILKRKIMYRGFRNFNAPNEFGVGILQNQEIQPLQNEVGQNILKGLGCSAGIYEAPARVIISIDEIHLIRPGEIIITRFTDPSWTPVLGMIKGIVTEVGGLLSHAAVISREYGIPAILNVIGATQSIKTGQTIRINGTTGEIVVTKDTADV